MENAAYLQDVEEASSNKDLTNFEVDSIELETPKLFSDNDDDKVLKQEGIKNELEMFESSKSEEEILKKEPEMFEESNSEEDFEIPAFLRRQKN